MRTDQRSKLKTSGELVKKSFKEWSEDKASRLAAAMAYYTIFSIAPLLIITVAIAGWFFDRNVAQDQLIAQFSGLIGQEGAEILQTMLESANKPANNLIASVVGIVTLMFGASGVFNAMQDALNTIWEVIPKPNRGLRGIIKDRTLSFSMVLVIGFLLLVMLVVSTLLSAITSYFSGNIETTAIVMQVINFFVSFAITTIMFAMIFKIVPDVEIAWRNVWLGAVVTSILFSVGRFAIGTYLGNSSVTSAYGAAGSLVVILVWVYYSAQILFLGAEFTQVYTGMYSSRPAPMPNAISLTEQARAQQGMPHKVDS
jgi:membrane protein